MRPTAAVCESLSARFLLFGGDLDSTFGNRGTAMPFRDAVAMNVYDIAVQSNGKTVAVGAPSATSPSTYQHKTIVARLTSAGAIDTTFGTSGYFVFDFKSLDLAYTDIHRASIEVQSDNKIIIIGWCDRGGPESKQGVIARLTSNGALDTTFGTGGKIRLLDFDQSNSGYETTPTDVKVQPDGKVVVVGAVIPNSTDEFAFGVARYTQNGVLDTTFSDDGFRYVLFDSGAYPNTVQIAPDGKIVVGGYWYHYANSNSSSREERFAVARLSSSGVLDSSFSGDGRWVEPFASSYTENEINDLAVQADNKIVVVGRGGPNNVSSHNATAVRLNVNGTRDTTFGTSNGGIEYDFDNENGQDAAFSIVVGKAGKFIIGESGGVFCLTPNGQFDSFFAGDGTLNTQYGAFALNLTTDGKIVGLMPGGELVRFYDRALATIGVATLSGTFSEQGTTSASFFITRQENLSVATRVYFSVTGTATHPNGNIVGRANDFTGTNIAFQGPGNNRIYVDIPANTTSTFVTLTAIDDSLVEGDETAIFDVAADDAYDTFADSDEVSFLIRDNDILSGPAVLSFSFVYDQSPNVVKLVFNQNVGGSLTDSDLTYTGLPAGMTHTLSYVPTTNTATITFSKPVLADGNYSITLPANRVTNSAGTANTSSTTLNFFSLAGDANHDRVVNFDDLIPLAQHYNQTGGATYATGDFNYDGNVNFDDLIILAQHYNKSVPAAVVASPSATKASQRRPAISEIIS